MSGVNKGQNMDYPVRHKTGRTTSYKTTLRESWVANQKHISIFLYLQKKKSFVSIML